MNYSVYDDGTSNGTIVFNSGVVGSNNMDAYPLFVDSTNYNLRILNNSSAINAGNNTATTLSLDLDALARKNGQIDIGAYENPFVNCPSQIDLIGLYAPYIGTFEAKHNIILHAGAMKNNLELKAPEITIHQMEATSNLSTLLLSKIGCQ